MRRRGDFATYMVTALGTLWIAALIVAYFLFGFAIESEAFWIFGVFFVAALVLAPFVIFAIARDFL